MLILYNTKTDMLYIRLDDKKQQVINKRVPEDIVLDLGENNRIVGIEILDASKHLNLVYCLRKDFTQNVIPDLIRNPVFSAGFPFSRE